MKQINLLPPELANQARRQRVIPAVVLAVLVAVAGILVPWYIFGTINEIAAASVDAQEKLLTSSPQDTAKQDAIGKDLAVVANKTTLLNNLAKRETDWDKAFEQLSKLVPREIVLTSYNVGVSTVDTTIRLNGVAPTNLSFANFVESLKSNTELKSVAVDAFNFSPTKGDVTFTIIVILPIEKVRYQAGGTP